MTKTQGEMLKIASALEKQGHHIVEVYNAAGFLQVFINGDKLSLWQMQYLLKKK